MLQTFMTLCRHLQNVVDFCKILLNYENFCIYWLTGQIALDATCGALKVLTSAEELTLINWILMMLTIGYPVTKQQMLDEVEFILKLDGCETPFTTTQPGKSWYQCFANEYKRSQ